MLRSVFPRTVRGTDMQERITAETPNVPRPRPSRRDPEPGDQQTAKRRAGKPEREGSVDLVERVRLREDLAVDEVRDDRAVGGAEHRLACAVACDEDEQLPE
jgi:hypothetical protein